MRFVNSTTDYYEQPQVINGVSDLFGEVLGERGRGEKPVVTIIKNGLLQNVG